MNTRKLTTLSLLTAPSLILFIIESAIPPLIPVPGIKLGLANIVTLFILSQSNFRDAAMVLFVRILLSSIFTGQAVYFLYSIAGGVCCLLAMAMMNWFLQKRFLSLTSITGAIFHNIGQILAACLIVQSFSMTAYLPVLLLSAIVTGFFTGLCTHFLNAHFHMVTLSDK